LLFSLGTCDEKQPSDPEISFAEMSFSGALQLATSEQEQIAASIKHAKVAAL
jgi:hypothetical protein